MKRNISDLLDACRDENVELDGGTPLSPSRIKELTMNKITQEKSRKRRVPARVLIAAAVVAALSVSALAANYVFGAGALLQDYFAANGETLTPGQVEVMDQIGKTFEGGVTSNGATITPVAALADEHVYYLRLRIEAPEGVVLPDLDGDVDGHYKLSGDLEPIELDLSAYESYGYGFSLTCLPDSDPTDNVKEMVLRYVAQPNTDLSFNDGVSKLMTIRGLWVHPWNGEYTQILSGEFTFDIGMCYESQVVPLECDGYTDILERLELSPLSLSYKLTDTMPDNDWSGYTLRKIQIVLKDGTVFWEAEECSGFITNEGLAVTNGGFVAGHEGYLLFDTPLDLTQVDYVQYGEYKIPVEVG